MKNSTTILLVFLVIGVFGFFLFNNSPSGSEPEDEPQSNVTGDVQKITLGFKSGNYYPQTVKVKAGQPVEINLDSSVYGCYRAFTIRQLGLSKYLKTPNDTLKFTPEKKGTYKFACSMGMGTGTLIVE